MRLDELPGESISAAPERLPPASAYEAKFESKAGWAFVQPMARLSVCRGRWSHFASPSRLRAIDSQPMESKNRSIRHKGAVALAAATLLAAQSPRFDMAIREDLFAGLGGDQARFEKAMKVCQEVLASDPKNPSALVWHGTGLFYQSGAAYRNGDFQKGMELHSRAFLEMNEAVGLAPDDLQTLIPRGATLIGTARFVPDEEARANLKVGIADYEKVLRIEGPHWEQMSIHSRGELLGGLADGYRRLGDRAKSREYLERIVRELTGSVYERKANAWLADLNRVTKEDHFCLGCHVSK